jgi:hypothetical protein
MSSSGPAAKPVKYTEVFHFFTEAKVESLEAAVAKCDHALSLVDHKGRSIHARVLDQVIVDSLLDETPAGDHVPFQESSAALRWLLDRNAPFLALEPEDRPEHLFVVPQWADKPRAPVIASLMTEYIQRGLLDINGDVVCEQWNGKGRRIKTVFRSALRGTFHHGNHAAARVLLLAGASEAHTLAGTGHDNLAALAASYAKVSQHNKVAAVVIETQMSMRIAQQRDSVAAKDSAPAVRRRLVV